MSYEAAIEKAWDGLLKLNPAKELSVKFLADEYSIDLAERKVLSLSCNVPAKNFVAILILHYLAKKIEGLPDLSGKWLSFKELSAIEGYDSAFRKRAIEPMIRKYGNNPEGLLSVLERLPAKKSNQADISLVIEVFEKAPALVTFWRKDEEFSADANILFDKNITRIFCTEDIIVLAQFIASSL